MYNAHRLTELLQKQHQQRNQSDLFRQGEFTIQWRAKVGSFPHPDGETIISAGEPCGAWKTNQQQPRYEKIPQGKGKERTKYPLEQYSDEIPQLPLNGYVPGSSIRGIVREWAKQNPDIDSDSINSLLGYQDRENNQIYPGKIIFLDAYPQKPTPLNIDIVNPQEKFQVYHDTKKQSNPCPLYTFGDGKKQISVIVAIQGISKRANEDDVNTVWSWLEQALAFYGVGSRTASGYGSLRPKEKVTPKLPQGYKKKIFKFTLYGQGCGGVDTRENTELRPSHWRGWLRSWALRFFLGVMSEENAEKTVGELFGAIELPTEPKQIKGCVRLKMIKGKIWGEKSEDEPHFYTWKGQIQISAPQDILNKIILPIIKFAVSIGGVGRGWRRPLHIFTMNNGREAARGTHLTLTHKIKDSKTNKLKSCYYRISPKNPKLWRDTYQKWCDAVRTVKINEEEWNTRFVTHANRNLEAEVFSPYTCAIYAVPDPIKEPINADYLTWENSKPSKNRRESTRGQGMILIYKEDYKRKIEVGGDATGGNSYCSWVSIKRINTPHPDIVTDCQEIVCLFLGGTNPNSQGLRAKFLRDLHNTKLDDIKVAIHLFGVKPK